MNRRAMPQAPIMHRTRAAGALVTAIAAAVLLASCGSASTPAPQPPLAGARIGGPFALIDGTGKTVRWDDFAGKYRMVYFGYTFCPDVCPLDVQRMMQGLARYEKAHPDQAKNIQPIFITIDPARDTPQVVGEFASAFYPRLIGLTGSEAQIAATAKAFAAYSVKGEAQPGGGYLVDHSRTAYLMGPKGEPIALLPVDQSADAVAAELTKWVR